MFRAGSEAFLELFLACQGMGGLLEMEHHAGKAFRAIYGCLRRALPAKALAEMFRTDLDSLYDVALRPFGSRKAAEEQHFEQNRPRCRYLLSTREGLRRLFESRMAVAYRVWRSGELPCWFERWPGAAQGAGIVAEGHGATASLTRSQRPEPLVDATVGAAAAEHLLWHDAWLLEGFCAVLVAPRMMFNNNNNATRPKFGGFKG